MGGEATAGRGVRERSFRNETVGQDTEGRGTPGHRTCRSSGLTGRPAPRARRLSARGGRLSNGRDAPGSFWPPARRARGRQVLGQPRGVPGSRDPEGRRGPPPPALTPALGAPVIVPAGLDIRPSRLVSSRIGRGSRATTDAAVNAPREPGDPVLPARGRRPLPRTPGRSRHAFRVGKGRKRRAWDEADAKEFYPKHTIRV